jgi:hypothetical protein
VLIGVAQEGLIDTVFITHLFALGSKVGNEFLTIVGGKGLSASGANCPLDDRKLADAFLELVHLGFEARIFGPGIGLALARGLQLGIQRGASSKLFFGFGEFLADSFNL